MSELKRESQAAMMKSPSPITGLPPYPGTMPPFAGACQPESLLHHSAYFCFLVGMGSPCTKKSPTPWDFGADPRMPAAGFPPGFAPYYAWNFHEGFERRSEYTCWQGSGLPCAYECFRLLSAAAVLCCASKMRTQSGHSMYTGSNLQELSEALCALLSSRAGRAAFPRPGFQPRVSEPRRASLRACRAPPVRHSVLVDSVVMALPEPGAYCSTLSR